MMMMMRCLIGATGQVRRVAQQYCTKLRSFLTSFARKVLPNLSECLNDSQYLVSWGQGLNQHFTKSPPMISSLWRQGDALNLQSFFGISWSLFAYSLFYDWCSDTHSHCDQKASIVSKPTSTTSNEACIVSKLAHKNNCKQEKSHPQNPQLSMSQGEAQHGISKKHPSRDVIFSGQNLARKTNINHITWHSWAFQTSTFGITWYDHFWPNLRLEVAEGCDRLSQQVTDAGCPWNQMQREREGAGVNKRSGSHADLQRRSEPPETLIGHTQRWSRSRKGELLP